MICFVERVLPQSIAHEPCVQGKKGNATAHAMMALDRVGIWKTHGAKLHRNVKEEKQVLDTVDHEFDFVC